MRLCSFIFFICFSLLYSSAYGRDSCFVLDIDLTLAREFTLPKDEGNLTKLPELIERQEVLTLDLDQEELFHYFLFPGAKNLIKYLLTFKGFKIKFFSVGAEIRNRAFTTKFLASFIPDGILKKLYAQKQFEVYSYHDALQNIKELRTAENTARALKRIRRILKQDSSDFAKVEKKAEEKLKKNLLHINCDPHFSVLIDDNPAYIFEGQTENFLSVPDNITLDRNTENELFLNLFREPGFQKTPLPHAETFFDRLNYVAGILSIARQESMIKRTSLPRELDFLQKNHEGIDDYLYNSYIWPGEYFQVGEKILEEHNGDIFL